MIVYKHDEKGFALTAYEKRKDGSLEPVAWLDESPQGWTLHDGISIHTYNSFAAVCNELENRFK